MTMEQKELRQYCQCQGVPIITPNTEDFLIKKINEIKPKNILEIWGAIWYSTMFFAQNIKKRNGHIISFELSLPSYKQWLANIQKSKLDNILYYLWDFENIVHSHFFVKKKFDMIFIDARKSKYLNFLKICENYINIWWIVVLDDMIKFWDKNSNIISYIKQKWNKYSLEKIDIDDWVLQIYY